MFLQPNEYKERLKMIKLSSIRDRWADNENKTDDTEPRLPVAKQNI